MNIGSLILFSILLVATVSVASSSDLPKIARGCVSNNMARTELTNTPCTPFEYAGEEYNDGCDNYKGEYLWCSTGRSWNYCGPCLDDVAKENVTTPVAKESTEVVKDNEGANEKETETTEQDTPPKNTATEPIPATTEKTDEVSETTEDKPDEVANSVEPAHDDKPENVADNEDKVDEEAENKDDKTTEVATETATEQPKATIENKETKTAENPKIETTEPAKQSATEEDKTKKETKQDPGIVETPANDTKVDTSEEPEVTAQTPEKATTEPKVAPENPPVTTATSDCDDEDECAEATASGAGQPEETGEGEVTANTPVVATVEGVTEEGATKETTVTDNTNDDKADEGKEVVEVEEEDPKIVEGKNKGDKKDEKGVSNVFKITIIVCVVFLLTGVVITGIIVKKRLHRDEYLAGREEKGLKIDLDGVKANSHEKITSVDNVA